MDKEKYIAPDLCVVTFKLEQGFAFSNNGYGPDESFLGLIRLMEEDEGYNAQGQENWTEWTEESDYFGSGW